MTDPKNHEGFIKTKRTKATHVGQKCPVCGGYGTLKYGTLKCHGCKGRGYILVPAVEVEVRG